MKLLNTPGIIYCDGFDKPEVFTSEGFLFFDSPRINRASICCAYTNERQSMKLIPDNSINFYSEKYSNYKFALEYRSAKPEGLSPKIVIDPRLAVLAKPFYEEDLPVLEPFSVVFKNNYQVFSRYFTIYSREDLLNYRNFFAEKENDIVATSLSDKEFWKMYILIASFVKAKAISEIRGGFQKLQISFKKRSLAFKFESILKSLNLKHETKLEEIKERNNTSSIYTKIFFYVGEYFTKKVMFGRSYKDNKIRFRFENLTKKEMSAIYAAICQYKTRPVEDHRKIQYFTVHSKRFASLIQYVLTCFGIDCYYNRKRDRNNRYVLIAKFGNKNSHRVVSNAEVYDAHSCVTVFRPNKSGIFLVRFAPFQPPCYVWIEKKDEVEAE